MKFMAVFRLKPDADRKTVAELVPKERTRTRELHDEGLLEEIYVGVDDTAYIVFEVADRGALDAALRSFPLHDYADWEVKELR